MQKENKDLFYLFCIIIYFNTKYNHVFYINLLVKNTVVVPTKCFSLKLIIVELNFRYTFFLHLLSHRNFDAGDECLMVVCRLLFLVLLPLIVIDH